MKMDPSRGELRELDQASDQGKEVMGILTGGLVVNREQAIVARFARNHDIAIQDLKNQLVEKDREITELRQKLKKVEERNNNLQIKLTTKDEEVNDLKARIQTLEEEKKDLQVELAGVEKKLKLLENEMKDLAKSSKAHEDENRKLKEELRQFEFKLESTDEHLTAENEKLKKEVQQLKESQASQLVHVPALTAPPPNEETQALLHLGELCWQIQGKMYQKVLPKYYTPLRSYKVKNIQKDVKKLLKTEEERSSAKQTLKVLQTKLNWSEDIEESIRSVQDSRNTEAHPQISEKMLIYYITVLERKDLLKGSLEADRLRELVNIWKSLNE